jgi:hypothetical protein
MCRRDRGTTKLSLNNYEHLLDMYAITVIIFASISDEFVIVTALVPLPMLSLFTKEVTFS